MQEHRTNFKSEAVLEENGEYQMPNVRIKLTPGVYDLLCPLPAKEIVQQIASLMQHSRGEDENSILTLSFNENEPEMGKATFEDIFGAHKNVAAKWIPNNNNNPRYMPTTQACYWFTLGMDGGLHAYMNENKTHWIGKMTPSMQLFAMWTQMIVHVYQLEIKGMMFDTGLLWMHAQELKKLTKKRDNLYHVYLTRCSSLQDAKFAVDKY